MSYRVYKKITPKNPTEVYKEVLDGRLRKFPQYFFSYSGNNSKKMVCAPIIRYLIEEELQWDREDIKEKLNRKTFRKYKLGGMLTHIFNDSPYLALDVAYPNEYKPWELKRYA